MRYRFVKFIPLAIAAVALFGFIVMQLWNHALVPSTGWHPLTYWQALGLLILAKILFGGFRGGPGRHWRHRMHDRWEKMTPEEREKFREGMRGRCGHAAPPPAE
jgi:hypothetical protein